VRFQSTSASSAGSSSSSSNAGGGSSHFASGLAGGLAGGALLYGVYLLTPSGKALRTFNKTAKEATKKYQEASQKLQQSTPDADEAINYIKQFCYTYVGWLPGGRQYVDTAFKDVEVVRQKHHDEANQIINDAYRQFQDLSKSGGLNLDTLSRAYEILADLSKKLGGLTGDALSDVLDNHPQVKEKFGGSIDQLKQMGEQYGPEAKKQVDETWRQVKDIMAGGLSAASLEKARRLVEEKVEQVKKLGDEAWDKAMEQAKPYLEKNPKVKELIEKNKDALKQGNATELFNKAKDAVESGDLGNLQQYVDQAVDKTKSQASKLTGGGLDQYFDMIPSGSEILAKVKQLKEVAEKHKDEGEKLLKETMAEVKEVLDKKSQKAEEIAEKAKEEAK